MRTLAQLGWSHASLAKSVARAARKAGMLAAPGPADDWPNFSPAPQSPARQALYHQDTARRAQQDRDARTEQAKLRAQQQAVTAAIADNGGYPLPADHPLSQVRNDMRTPRDELFQRTPADEDRDGRSTTAKAIAALHKSIPRNEIARHFSAANALQKDRPRDTATAHGERYLHLSLDNPTGDVLREGVSPTALEAIRQAVTGRPRQLNKSTGLPDEDDDSAEDTPDPSRAGGIDPSDNTGYTPTAAKPTQGAPRQSASMSTPRALPQDSDQDLDETTKAIKAIHANGAQPMWSR
jgi:hypothetical protein